MKKFYLPLVAAATILGAGSAFAQEPELTQVWSKIYDWQADSWGSAAPNWSNPEAIKSGACTRVGVGINGKLYSVNMQTMSIMEFDAEGNRDVYKLPSLEGRTISYNLTDESFSPASCPDYYGTLITRDDAGHFLVGHGFTTGAMPTTWTVFDPATSKAKHFDVEFPTAPRGSMLRIDAVGRALGDVTQDGMLWIAPTSIYWDKVNPYRSTWATAATQVVKMIYFGGEGEINDNLVATGYVSNSVSLGGQLSSVCQPRYETMDEVLAEVEKEGDETLAYSKSFILYSKGAGAFATNKYSLVFGYNDGVNDIGTPFADLASTDMGNNYAGYTGFDTFVLNGERYYVANYQTEEENKLCSGSMKLAVFDSKGMIVKTWDNPGYASIYGYCTISAEKIDETSANIYVYCGTINLKASGQQAAAAAQLVFKAGESAGINDIVVNEDENAAPVYYNLQGVQVANPENGIFVVKRGNKVTKEVR